MLVSAYSYILHVVFFSFLFFFFKQKTAYEMRISDWSSDVCSSDLCRSARTDIADVYRSEIECNRVHFKLLRTEFTRNTDSSQYGMVIDEIGRASCRERVCQYV